MRIWRIKLQPDYPGAAAYCLEHNIAGYGWCLDGGPPANLQEHWDRALAQYRTEAGPISRFFGAFVQAEDDLCWTMNAGRYYLGQLGGWGYTGDAQANDLHIGGYRACQWQEFPSDEVPGPIQNAFAAQGQTFCRIAPRDHLAYVYSQWLHGGKMGVPEIDPEWDLISLLAPLDLEDLVGVYLQHARGYIFYPKSGKRDKTPHEWEMIQRETCDRAVSQVKSGNAQITDAQAAELAGLGMKVFLFTASGPDPNIPRGADFELLDRAALIGFADEHRQLMPRVIQNYLDWIARAQAAKAAKA